MKNTISILLLLCTSFIWSQNYKFGKVSIDELKEISYSKDPTANAVILYSEVKTVFDYSEEDGFYIKTEYFERIKIYNKEGFDYATKKINLYYSTASAKEEALFFKATTYNLENGKIVKTKLKGSNIFLERLNKYNNIKKFTMPNLKEGSIVEWKYTFKSPFLSMLDEIKVQEEIPIKKIKARIAIPEYLTFNSTSKGHIYIPITRSVKTKTLNFGGYKEHNEHVRVQKNEYNSSSLTYNENISSIEMENIPALIEEPYSGNINNYKSGIIFELSTSQFPNTRGHSYAKSWESVVKNIYKSQYFGDQLDKTKHFSEDIPGIIAGKISEEEKMLAIYQFVKSKIKWNGIHGFQSDEGTRKAYKEGVGNTADVNLNLVAMLRSSGLDANPVLVSTVSHGIPLFPTRFGFNYVIASVNLKDGHVLLDATDPYATPNILPSKTLNFRGRIVYPDGESKWIELFPKQHSVEKNTINVKFTNAGFGGNARSQLTKRYAYQYRKEAKGKSQDELLSWIEENLEDVEVIDSRISNLDHLGKDVSETIKFETESFYEEINDKTYISPSLYLQIDENPFVAEERTFPVFYNTPWATINTINITIPDDYTIESTPENAEYLLPDEIGVYQNNIVQNGQQLKVTTSFVINKPVIDFANYQNLKEFYKLIIIKQAEKIVLVKNK